MRLASRSVQGLCLGAAFALHLIGLNAWPRGTVPEIAATGAPAKATFGSSFADLAVGVMQPIPIMPPTSPSTGKPIPPTTAGSLTIRSDIFDVTPVVKPQPTEIPLATKAVIPGSIAALRVDVVPTPRDTAPTTVAPITPTETLKAAADAASTRSLRPVARPPDLKTSLQAAQKGNASQTAVAGASNDRDQGKARQSRSNASSISAPVQSNAAATNYQGEVLRRISSVRRPRTNARGVAVVAFSISANGSAAGVGILRSSGSRELDQLAQRVIRMAEPFPPPPPGARTNWQIEIAGR